MSPPAHWRPSNPSGVRPPRDYSPGTYMLCARFLRSRVANLPSLSLRPPTWQEALRTAPFRQQNHFRPRIKRDYPLNLSILISGGKETNKDSLSDDFFFFFFFCDFGGGRPFFIIIYIYAEGENADLVYF